MDWIVIVAGLVIALGVMMLYRIVDREGVTDKTLYPIMILGLVLIFGGFYLIFYFIPAEIVKRKIYGFVLTVFGFWLTFKFPDSGSHQGGDMSVLGMLFGIVMLVLGLYWFMF